MFIVTLTDYVPLERYDSLPWTGAKIQESVSQSGPWVDIQTFVLNPVDSDPTQPQERSFTSTAATLEAGWYRIVWTDSLGTLLATDPLLNVPAVDVLWKPTAADVANMLWTRTVTPTGEHLGVFSNSTRPTATQAEALLNQAVLDVAMSIGNTIPSVCLAAAKNVATIRAAMLIEITYFPEQIGTERSPYDRLKALYDEQLKLLVQVIQAEEADEGIDDTTQATGMAQYSFPSNDLNGLVGWNSQW